jgi:hypothetical protein
MSFGVSTLTTISFGLDHRAHPQFNHAAQQPPGAEALARLGAGQPLRT